MDRYSLFRKVMDLVADDFEVTNAKMFNWADSIEISGKYGGMTIKITVEIEEVQQDGD